MLGQLPASRNGPPGPELLANPTLPAVLCAVLAILTIFARLARVGPGASRGENVQVCLIEEEN